MTIAQQPVALASGAVVADSVFWYTIAFTFGAAGTDNFNTAIQIDADGHFLCSMSCYENTLEAGAGVNGGTKIANGGALVTITDGGSQRALSNAQVPVRSIFGDSRQPYVWPIQHLFRARTSIGLNVTGIGATNGNAVLRLTFCGWKRPVS